MTSDRSIEKIGQTIRDFLAVRPDKDDPRQSDGSSTGARQSVGAPAHVGTENAATDQDAHSAARVQLLGLDLIREQLGKDWEKFGEKAKGHIERTLSQRLSPVDVFKCVGELRYAIVFASLPEPEAKAKVALIASEIWQKLFGETEPPKGVTLESVVVEVDGSTSIDSLDDLIDKQQQAEPESKRAPSPGVAPEEPAQKPDAKPKPPAAEPLPKWQAVYRPIWDVEREVVVAYRFTPMAKSTSGDVLRDHDVLIQWQPDQQERRPFAGADRQFIQSVQEGLKHEGRRPSRCLMICPVHYETFITRDDERCFLRLIRDLPPSFRADLILELVGVPDGLPHARLAEIMASLKPVVRNVYCRAFNPTKWFRDLADAGIVAIGFDFAELALPEIDAFNLIPKFATAASNAGLHSYAMGIDRLSLATHAVCSGISYLAGDSIMRSTPKIEHVFRYGARDLVYPLARSHGKGC
jgi:hypothetical protein